MISGTAAQGKGSHAGKIVYCMYIIIMQCRLTVNDICQAIELEDKQHQISLRDNYNKFDSLTKAFEKASF